MTAAQLVMVCFGFVLNALTFGLGICVGISLTTRKESQNDNGNV